MIRTLIKAAGGFLGRWKTTLIAGGIALAVGFGAGWRVQGWRWDAAESRAYQQALEQARREFQRSERIANAHAAREAERRERVRAIEREVQRVQQATREAADCVVAPDFQRVWNDAAEAAGVAEPAGGRDAPVPDGAATGGD